MGGFRVACGGCSPGSGALGEIKGASQGLCDMFAEGFSNEGFFGASVLAQEGVDGASKC
jgi:hypothetical protein